MIDIETHQPLVVNTEGDGGPYLMVPMEQLADVQQILQKHGIDYLVADDAVQLDGKPVIAIIDFGHNFNVEDIQAALDAA